MSSCVEDVLNFSAKIDNSNGLFSSVYLPLMLDSESKYWKSKRQGVQTFVSNLIRISRSKKRITKKLLVIQAPSDLANHLLAEVRKMLSFTVVRATTQKRTADWFRQQANTCENSAVMDSCGGKVLFIGQLHPFDDELEDNYS